MYFTYSFLRRLPNNNAGMISSKRWEQTLWFCHFLPLTTVQVKLLIFSFNAFFVFMCTIFPRSLPCAITEALFSPNSRAAEGKMIFGGNLSAGTLVACTNKRQKKNYDFDPVDQIKAVEKALVMVCCSVAAN